MPSLWLDILEKVKAAGLNAISVYTHMGLINPSREVVDFDGFRALQPLYDAAKQTGIWIVLRPGEFHRYTANMCSLSFLRGPYINAETSAGGIAHWATAEVAGNLRTNDSDWKAAWQDYIQAIIEVTVPNQITAGGPVIGVSRKFLPPLRNLKYSVYGLSNPNWCVRSSELTVRSESTNSIDNEYTQKHRGHAEYFADLEAAYRNSGIVVPLTYNDLGPLRNFINGTVWTPYTPFEFFY